MIWDRRVTSKAVTSHSYLQAIEGGDIPWGGVLKLDKVIDTDFDPQLAEGKHSLIRSLRFSRDRRGLLAVLSRTGQLKVLETNKESSATDTHSPTGPELLHVSKSHEMFVSYKEAVRKNDRIVSFDWITLPSPSLRPRLFVLRANGSFDILEQPTNTLDHIYKLVPWQTPYRGLEGRSWIWRSSIRRGKLLMMARNKSIPQHYAVRGNPGASNAGSLCRGATYVRSNDIWWQKT